MRRYINRNRPIGDRTQPLFPMPNDVAVSPSEVTRTSADSLPAKHRNAFDRAILNVLLLRIAEITYAQILDGLPLAEVAADNYHTITIPRNHPIWNHVGLCPGVLQASQNFHESWNSSILRFDCRLIRAFSDAELNSNEFRMRLVEMVAVAIHDIGVQLFRTTESHHKDLESWPRLFPSCPRPALTMFIHPDYILHERYPNGIADMVGYWAENRILGGVALFDRGSTGLECNDIFFHSNHREITQRPYSLTDSQREALFDFLLAEPSSPTTTPLPILAGMQNRLRVDTDFATQMHHVFRDWWERKLIDHSYIPNRRPKLTLDYPELVEEGEGIRRLLGQ